MLHLFCFKAMGVYLYGELMVQEDPQQQALACRCLSLVQEEMDQSARKVVEEMVLWYRRWSLILTKKQTWGRNDITDSDESDWNLKVHFQLLQWAVNWDHFITFPLFLISNVTALWRDGGERVLLRGTVHAQTTATCASHSCPSSLTVRGCRPRKGLFHAFKAVSSGCVCHKRNLGMCFLNKRGRKEGKGSARTFWRAQTGRCCV